LKKRKDRSWWFFVFCFVFLSFGQVNFLPTSSSSSSAPRRISGSLASTNAFSNSHRVQFGWPDWEAGLEFYGIMLEKRKKKSKISNLIQDLSLHLASQNNVCHFIQRSHRRKQQLEAEAEAGEKWNWHDLQWKWQTNLGFYRLGFLLGEIHHDLRLINSLGKRRKSKSINWKAKQKKKPRQVHWPQNKQPPCHTSQFQHQRAPRRHRWSLLPMNLHHSEALSQKCPQQLHMEGWIWVSPGSFLYSLFSALLSPFIHSAHLSGIAPISLTDSEPALSHSKSPFPQGSAWQIQMSRVRSTKKTPTRKNRWIHSHRDKGLPLFTRERSKLEFTLQLSSFSELLRAVWLTRSISVFHTHWFGLVWMIAQVTKYLQKKKKRNPTLHKWPWCFLVQDRKIHWPERSLQSSKLKTKQKGKKKKKNKVKNKDLLQQRSRIL